MPIIVSKHGLAPATGRVKQHHGDFMAAQVTECERIIDAAVSKIDSANSNPDLTVGGKMKLRWAAARDGLLEVGKISSRGRAHLEKELTAAKAAIPVFPNLASTQQITPELLHHQLAEVRRFIVTKPPEERQLLLSEAARTGDLDTLMAFTTAPTVMALVTTEKLEAAKDTYLRTVHAAEYERVEVVQEAIQHFEYTAVMTGRLLAKDLPSENLTDIVPPGKTLTDPVASIAKGSAA